MDTGYLLAAALAVALLLWWWHFSRTADDTPSASVLSDDISLTPVPLLTDAQLLIYNLLRLAVQDRYLVFVHVPLWSFIQIDADGPLRTQIFRQIAFKRVDFALVHPGSRRVEQVVEMMDALPASQDTEHRQIVKTVLEAAGIPLRVVKPRQSYSVDELSALLELDGEE